MLIDSLAYVLERSGALDHLWSKLDAGHDAALGIAASARPFVLAAQFARRPRTTLAVVAGEDQAQAFARAVAAYLGDHRVLRFPERSDGPFGSKPADPRAAARRMEAAHALRMGREVVVVASARSLVRLMPPAQAGVCDPLELSSGLDLADPAAASAARRDPERPVRAPRSFEQVAEVLLECGYQNVGQLEGPGTFCVHGGIVDVYPGNLPYPVRLDFFGDELDDIRRIVPSTGQTIAALERISIYPVREFSCAEALRARACRALARPARTNPRLRELLEQAEGGLHFDRADSLLPYLYDDANTLGAYVHADALVALMEPRALFDDAAHAIDDARKLAQGSNLSFEGLMAASADLDFGKGQRVVYQSLMRVGGGVDAELPVKRVDVAGDPEKLFGRLRHLVDDDFTVVFSAPNLRARTDMKLAFVDRGIPILERLDADDGGDADDGREVGDGPSASPASSAPARTALQREARARVARPDDPGQVRRRRLKRGVVNVVDVDVPLGMIVPKARLAIVSVFDTQGAGSRRPTRRVDVTEVTFPYQPGDYVVHAVHGIAYFSGLVRQEVNGTEGDYLQLEYAEGDKLFVPVDRLDRVTRYVGPEGSSPRLTRLNTSDWSRALSKARKATKKLAFDLVDVYARRAAVQGFRFGPDTVWQREMEDAFPYSETPDQLAAIADVKADMQAARPMDRLICGDVGFGKTEVALRAAFKATQDAKQVMVLCPTTILAQQHYTNFRERFEPFGVRVEVMSRFRTPAQQRAALEGFAEGSVSVLVGTHRLLSRDVNPHDLGLVIIDEEQRFGVGHKEQLKNLREHIDVLTLSATPIPRTMQMSLSGVRDMSLILTPPDERRPVEVHVGEWDPDLVSQAIARELDRKGQVYYVSNRVRSIDEAVRRVSEAAGEARVGVAHGQMDKDALERVMEEFSAGQLDVLVATTIIESGIDNPHTNTLIIEDAQRLGLAQLYQLKGRVGRSSAQAYAYFMFPDNIPLTEEATARLVALGEHRELGSGMRIAMRDLEIRGAGSILGAEQSGNMSAVGFDLFAQMLSEAVTAAREGEAAVAVGASRALSDVTVNLPGDAFLPEDYLPEVDERVRWYRRLASAPSAQAVDELRDELALQRPGMPMEASCLFAKARLRTLAFEHRIELVAVVDGKLVAAPIEVPARLSTSLRRAGGRWLASKRKLHLPLKYFAAEDDLQLLEALGAFLADVAQEGQRTTQS
ncbi:transcription-repair coupling factor [Berryella wangjianweii]|uniref:transcription-repair coupling factor n=1 Tax=Berryella wangjianweii TaxID=2734634 RepID=UPI0028F6CB16|nr:transcription-repair coupling factor [Berryella wangjianweii]